jgi:hypothetical protein
MTVGELIEELLKQDSEAEVFCLDVRSYLNFSTRQPVNFVRKNTSFDFKDSKKVIFLSNAEQ